MAKIIVSFKEKEKDLYEIIKQQGDQSNFIKDALKFYLANKKECMPVYNNRTEPKNDEIQSILQDI